MGKEPVITRRTILAGAVLLPVSAIRLAGQTTVPAVARVFSVEQRRTLIAFVDRLVPKDELGPSASECSVPEYIERCLADFLAAEKTAFLEALASVDALAQTAQGAPLADLANDKQDAVLTAMESEATLGLRAAFNRMRRLTLEGMFGDPAYGGNRNFAGWDLLRYPGAKTAVSEKDQRMTTMPVPYRKPLYSGSGDTHGH